MKNIIKNTVELFQQIKVDKNIKENNSLNNIEKTNDVILQDKIDSTGIIDNEVNSDIFDNNIKMLKIDQIEIDPEFSKLFIIKPEVLYKIKTSMIEKGFDHSQPVVVWENDGKYILIDGHTRIKAAIEIGLIKIFAYI